MSILSQNQKYHDVIPFNTAADAISIPIFCADFSDLQFTIVTDPTADFDIEVLKSNQQLNPPDPSLPSTEGNEYSDLAYTDESDGVNYNLTTPFNPGGNAVSKTFKLGTNGARWIFIKLLNYSAGALKKCDVDLFSNET